MANRFLEKLLLERCIADLLDAGFQVSVFDGEDYPIKRSTDAAAILAATRSTDEDYLYAYRPLQDGVAGWVRFIYGNGEDAVSDYSTNLEDVIKRTNALAEEMSA